MAQDPKVRFSFAHLDVNLYGSYKECMQFFYPRIVPGGIFCSMNTTTPRGEVATEPSMSFSPTKPNR